MSNIKKIFHDDIMALLKHFFALVIAIGVCFLPALYAWFNIYSNWDPYGNTAGLDLAAISLDEGYTTDGGVYKNVGSDLIENLHENKAVTWHFCDTLDEAINGVYDGTYYAAVVIAEDFSENMYDVFSEESKRPGITFYQNQKKNPVANKISDTVVSTIETNVDEAYVEAIVTILFESAGDLYSDLNEGDGVEGIIDRLSELNKKMVNYQGTIDSVVMGNSALINALEAAGVDTDELSKRTGEAAGNLKEVRGEMDDTMLTLDMYSMNLNKMFSDMNATLADMGSTFESKTLTMATLNIAKDGADFNSDARKLITDYNVILKVYTENTAYNPENLSDKDKKKLKVLGLAMGKVPEGGILGGEYTDAQYKEIASSANTVIFAVSDGITTLNKMILSLDSAVDGEKITGDIYDMENKLAQMSADGVAAVNEMQNNLNFVIIPEIHNCVDSLGLVMDDANQLMVTISKTLAGMGDVVNSVNTTVSASSVSLIKTREVLGDISERLSEVIDKVNAAASSEKLDVLISTLTGDPAVYGKFFSEPVEIVTKAVYPIENYGSAVAPFYTVLAIWVGSIILAAVIKTHVDKSKYPDATALEQYFGRYLIFFVLAQLQTIVIVVGDIELMGIQCLNPFMFWGAAALATTVFSLLIYSLVLSFGDVGKAIVVVLVVLQIAGSSGTYPIELLPDFFKKLYIFFPFPYAINAMREAICGPYESDYVIYMLQLSIFLIAAMAIGLIIRIPFERLNHFMEERMEETEMM